LPVFFAFTGLRTQIGLLNSAEDWFICLVIMAMAAAGKLGGSALAARLTGMKWRESLQLGALMNTRGLMELIALNIGYDMGILSQRIFTMLVIMALVTTVMTAPLVTFFGKRRTILSK
jgi:K+:H+ antiporter